MSPLAQLKALTSAQRSAFLACFLGWTLDAFDFFILIFVIKDIAEEFHVAESKVSGAIFLTLAFRPVGGGALRLAGGSLRTADAADGKRSLLLRD